MLVAVLEISIAVACLGAVACQSNIHDLGGVPEPVATIHARLASPLPNGIVHPRAAILWSGVPVYVPYCQRHGPNERDPGRQVSAVAAKACRDPFDVVPGLEETSVAIDRSATTFEIPILHLPSAMILVGAPPNRVGYASVVVYDDVDGDGALDLSRCGAHGGEGMTSSVSPAQFEQVWASSFSSLLQAQTRIVYVEGMFDKNSNFYPNPGCSVTPPGGFSIWTVGDLFDPTASCTSDPIDREIVLEVSTAPPVALGSCFANPRESFPHEPPSKLPNAANTIYECSTEGELVTTNQACRCPNSRIYTLKGCSFDDACTAYEWNVPVPPYWPCTTTSTSGK